MNFRGTTILEVLIVVAVISVVSLAMVSFLYQTVTARDHVLSASEASEAAQSLMERISFSIKPATSINVKQNGTVLEAVKNICEVYSLTGGQIYYTKGVSGGTCPSPTTTTSVSGSAVTVTNSQNPALTLFTGSPSATNSSSVTVNLRVKKTRPFASSEINLIQSIARRL